MTRIWFDPVGAHVLISGSATSYPPRTLKTEQREGLIWVMSQSGVPLVAGTYHEFAREDGTGFLDQAAAVAYLNGVFESREPGHSYSPPSASASWLVPHNLGRNPLVQVIQSDGETIGCRVVHLDLNTANVLFSRPTSGVAILS